MRSLTKLAVLLIAIVMMVGMTATVSAAAFSHEFPGKATHTSKWSNWGKAVTTTTSSYYIKTVITKQNKKGNTWYTPWYATTDNFRHVKGNDDLSYVKKTSTTHKISGSVSATIKAIGAKAGYSYSKTSGSEVTSKVAKNAKTGDYFFGCRANMKDLQQVSTIKIYKKNKKRKWYLASKSTSTASGALINSSSNNTGLYYQWRLQK